MCVICEAREGRMDGGSTSGHLIIDNGLLINRSDEPKASDMSSKKLIKKRVRSDLLLQQLAHLLLPNFSPTHDIVSTLKIPDIIYQGTDQTHQLQRERGRVEAHEVIFSRLKNIKSLETGPLSIAVELSTSSIVPTGQHVSF